MATQRLTARDVAILSPTCQRVVGSPSRPWRPGSTAVTMVITVISRRLLAWLTASLLVLLGVWSVSSTPARADTPSCALTSSASTPSAAGPGSPCWTDVLPYPFGSDGNPVDPNSALCARPGAPSGPDWTGDFSPEGGGAAGNPPCYLQVNSLAFRAWNRGLAATGLPLSSDPTATVGFGVWLYNGANWFPDPTFPGSGVCPGSIVLWAGKLDYWLVGPKVIGDTATPRRPCAGSTASTSSGSRCRSPRRPWPSPDGLSR